MIINNTRINIKVVSSIGQPSFRRGQIPAKRCHCHYNAFIQILPTAKNPHKNLSKLTEFLFSFKAVYDMIRKGNFVFDMI